MDVGHAKDVADDDRDRPERKVAEGKAPTSLNATAACPKSTRDLVDWMACRVSGKHRAMAQPAAASRLASSSFLSSPTSTILFFRWPCPQSFATLSIHLIDVVSLHS